MLSKAYGPKHFLEDIYITIPILIKNMLINVNDPKANFN